MELLKELCESVGIPGREGRLREIVRRELAPLADEVRVDALGNLIAVKKASKGRKPRRLMIAAHMDEIGFMVSHIDERGLLRLVPLGGHDPRNMVAQRVVVCGVKNDLPGLLYPGIKPPHIQTATMAKWRRLSAARSTTAVRILIRRWKRRLSRTLRRHV